MVDARSWICIENLPTSSSDMASDVQSARHVADLRKLEVRGNHTRRSAVCFTRISEIFWHRLEVHRRTSDSVAPSFASASPIVGKKLWTARPRARRTVL